jgi:hypothetical protein
MTTQTLSMISKAYAADIITEYSDTLNEDTVYSIAHEVADSSEHVIYYHKARELISNLTNDEFNGAEDAVDSDTGCEFLSYNKHGERLAYYALYAAITEALQELMQQQQQQQEEEEEGDK